ncbi:uncharacterized protein [Dermacentor andersoni]|uniref:uncharacterized protein n=1 Tax=Dermacentor andersoni TaxID=34620 RepID=UPI002155C842
MGGYASPPQFDETSNKWLAYQVRLEACFEGNGITDDKKKRALLVAALTTHTVDVLNGRCAPDKVNELTSKAVPVMATGIQQWALLLGAYNYVFKHQPGKDNVPAYAISRLPKSATSQPQILEETGDGDPPTKLLMGYELCSRLDNAVAPSGPLAPQSPVDCYVPGVLQPGEPVRSKNFGRGVPGIPARIASSDGICMVNTDGPKWENIR